MLEQTLTINNTSLKIIKKTLFSEKTKLKREIKEIPLHHRNYYTMINNRGRAYDDLLEAMDFYEIIK